MRARARLGTIAAMDNDEMREIFGETPEPDESGEDSARLNDSAPEESAEAGELSPAAELLLDAEEMLPEAGVMPVEAVAAERDAEAEESLAADAAAMLDLAPEAETEFALEAETDGMDELPDVSAGYDLPQALFDAGIDVDAALGALSFELSSGGYDEDRAAQRSPAFTPPAYKPALRMPSAIRLRRGHFGSVAPALVLIGVGAWLTLTNASGTPVDPALAGVVLAGGLIVSFAIEWLFSGRWARGLLLITLVVLLGVGGAALVLQSGADRAPMVYPLLLSALGVAIILSSLLARPVERRALGPGMVFITAGIAGFLVLNGAVPASVLSAAAAYWFVPAVIVLLLLLLPALFHRSSR